MAPPATPRLKLQRPPVVEALVDIKAKTELAEDGLKQLAAQLKSEFPKLKVTKNFEARLEVKEGVLVRPEMTPINFAGVHATSEDDTRVVQFRPDGFTFNNIRRYMGGDELISTALRLWNHFEANATPSPPTLLAVRYINKLELPITDGVELDDYLTTAPAVPDHLPSVAQFLTQTVVHDPSRPGAAVLIQRLLQEESKPIVMIDINVVLEGEQITKFSTTAEALFYLRALANRTFFSLITEETAKLYD